MEIKGYKNFNYLTLFSYFLCYKTKNIIILNKIAFLELSVLIIDGKCLINYAEYPMQ